MSRILCDDPIIIYHPNVVHYLTSAFYIMRGDDVVLLSPIDVDNIYEDSHTFLLNNFPLPCQVDDIDKYCAIDNNGEMFPIYIEVQCGCCPCCIARKMNSYQQRLEFELLTEVPHTTNLFVTLTYKNEFLPPWSNLERSEITSYIKRLKTFISKHCGSEFASSMKFLYSGEYGKRNTHRPHFHICVLHFPEEILLQEYDIFQVRLLFEYLWSDKANSKVADSLPFSEYYLNSYGTLNSSAEVYYDKYVKGSVYVEPIEDGNLGKYVGKYVSKMSNIQKAVSLPAPINVESETIYNAKLSSIKDYIRKPTFVRMSTNMGMSYFNSHIAPQLSSKMENNYSYLDLDGKVKKDCAVCSYYINKLFPTVSRVVSPEIRKTITTVRLELYNLMQRKYFGGYNLKKLLKLPYINGRAFSPLKRCLDKITYIGKNGVSVYDRKYNTYIHSNISENYHRTMERVYNMIKYLDDYFTANNDMITDVKLKRDTFIRNCISKITDSALEVQRTRLRRQYRDIQLSIKM